MKPIKNIVFTEKYINGQGEEKKRYTKVGKLFYNEQYQSFTIKLDSIPIGSGDNPFEGWLQTYDLDENRQQNGGQQPPQQQQYQQPAAPAQYAQQPPQQYAAQPAPQAQYAPPQPPVQQDNLPTEQDLNKPIDLGAIPF